MKRRLLGCSIALIAGLVQAEVLVNDSFDDSPGGTPSDAALQRFEQVSVVAGSGPIGDDPVLRFNDASTSRPGILEYNPGQAPVGAYYVSFDLFNNNPAGTGEPNPIIFCMGQWRRGKSIALGANARRAFALEFMNSGNSRTLAIRIGKSARIRTVYNMAEVQQVKVLVNDHDTLPLPYTRPDTKEAAELSPDSVVIYINNQLVGREGASGISMQSPVSQGDAVLGRVGFSSTTFSQVDFLIDNLKIMGIPAPGASTPAAASSSETASEAPAAQQKDSSPAVPRKEGAVYLNETFEDYDVGSKPGGPMLRRTEMVTVVDGGGKVGSGKVAHYKDDSDKTGGVLEYNVGMGGLGSFYIEYDLLNNKPATGDSDPIIFSLGLWNPSKGKLLSANAKRAFAVEFYQAESYHSLGLRVGSSTKAKGTYSVSEPQNVKIWVNDHDRNTLSYVRPDNGTEVKLNPDSFVVWVNNSLVGKEPEFGIPMQKTVSKGDKALGRVGFNTTTSGMADFLIDNLHVENPTGESSPVAAGTVLPSVTGEVTPTRLPGAETMAYREGKNAMNLFVYKPEGWKASDKRSAFVYFFGGGWTKGTPMKSGSTAAWAARHGMVGIAPDYRTKNRFGTSPLASVADSRAAFNWVVEHADKLGIDPNRIAVGGASAGGHVALWTALSTTPPGSDPVESPKVKPAAIYLSSAVTDTSPETGYTPSRFGNDAVALSPVDHLDAKMPPVLMFHAVDDSLVNYSTAVALHDKLLATGNECEFITVPRGGHGYSSHFPEWKDKTRAKLEKLFEKTGLLPAVR